MTFGSRPTAGLLLLAAALVLPSCQKKSRGSDEELGTLMHPVQIVTMETVEGETLAILAISLIVTFLLRLVFRSSIVWERPEGPTRTF